MMLHGETVQSALPMDLPWWQPDHFVFFGVLYVVLGVLAVALTYTIAKSWCDAKSDSH